MCCLLLEQGAEADQQSKNGLAALHLAAQEDKVGIAHQLLKNGANVRFIKFLRVYSRIFIQAFTFMMYLTIS